MAAERKPIDISDKPELLRLVEEMEATGEPCVLQRDGKDVAVLQPAQVMANPEPPVDDNPFLALIGLVDRYEEELDPTRPTDVSSNKHKYVADGYFDKHYDRE